MKWNWQQADWPEFSWKQERLAEAERQFLIGAGTLVGIVAHVGEDERTLLTVEAISTEAMTTSEIEGEILDRASVQSSIQRHLGLVTDRRRGAPREQGIAEMMVDLYTTWRAPLSHDALFDWHRMVMAGSRVAHQGRYRIEKEPMQIVSGRIGDPTVYFEAPPSSRMQTEMDQFIVWFNRTASGGDGPLPAVTRAGIAHLYFESIHPFEDGNGRIGRAIAEKALAQSLGQPLLPSISSPILLRRLDYYRALESASKQNEVTEWLGWFAGVAIQGQRQSIATVEFLMQKTKMFDRLRDQLNGRQEKALLRMFREGPHGFKGGLSAGNYVSITGASAATATRDLADLVEKLALRRVGERRHARYYLSVSTQPVKQVVVASDGSIIER